MNAYCVPEKIKWPKLSATLTDSIVINNYDVSLTQKYC